ncbi:pancreatic lipase-related protein 2 [Caerostris darwini]|uniref:Pancreatic lipase-related protein 2 n=1 Tax=Caerostris darwini TaxID=1538125 RepID=A0AAV4Q9R4_9ARAC|nr:pancreatic lipase-related protein 2 [Caerostris darwini]
MATKFLFLIFLCFGILGVFVQTQFLFPKCYPNVKQRCDTKRIDRSWTNTTMRFLLFTRRNPQEPELLHLCNGTLPKNSNFKAQNRFIVFIPGFMFGVCELDSISEIKDELLNKGDFNVLLVDGKEEYGMDFVYAKENSKRAANIIIKVLQNIQDETGFKNKDLYLIGHSLGAHTAGMVGQGFKVNRITGLDPGGVVFSKNTPDNMILDRNDAELVDVIHTNGGKGLPHLGISFPMGDADFYVNGGTIQPSCSYRAWNSIKSLNFLYLLGMASVPSICAHAQCLEYYKLSISNVYGKFIGFPCSSYKKFQSGQCTIDGATNVTMGFEFEKDFTPKQHGKKSVKYYVTTSSSWPFVSSKKFK